MELVGEFAAPDALPARAIAHWVPGLYHEALDDTVAWRGGGETGQGQFMSEEGRCQSNPKLWFSEA